MCLVLWSEHKPNKCMREPKALTRLRFCTGSSESSGIAYVMSTIISYASSNITYFLNWKSFFPTSKQCLIAYSRLIDIRLYIPLCAYEYTCTCLSVTSNINCIVARCQINVVYISGHVPLSGHDDLAHFEWRRLWHWINTKIENYVISARLQIKTKG